MFDDLSLSLMINVSCESIKILVILKYEDKKYI